jgi:RNA polymerase sigma-70 factor (ECF subfamily)
MEPIDLEPLRQRDSQAWDHLYQSCAARTYRVLYHITKAERSVLEELNQAVWLAAIESVSGIDGTRGTPQDWVLGIARFHALSYLRRKYRNRVVAVGCGSGWPAAEVDRETEARTERLGLIRASIESLPEHWQYVLSQKYEHGRSVKEIADLSHCTVKAIESILSRSRQRLRELTREQTEPKDSA